MKEEHPRPELSVNELYERLHRPGEGHRWFVLDVRNEDEAKGWRVDGPLRVPYVQMPYFAFIDDPEAALARVPAGLGEAVVVCAKGSSSELVAQVLREAGRAAVNVAGGMVAWGDFHVPVRVPLEPDQERRFELWQLNRYGKGCLSYVVMSGGEALIVDPSRFPELYEGFVRSRGARIVEVLETHVHADHLSGGARLARRNQARYRVLNAFGHEPTLGVELSPLEGDVQIRLGADAGVTVVARALRTPGHTPGSTCYLVDGRYLLSGDTLFVHGVGRPDLGGHVEEWGRALFHSLKDVVARLPDEVQVLPAHFESHEDADAQGVVRRTLGELRVKSPELALGDEQEFVRAMRRSLRAPPERYGDIIRANLGRVDPGEKAGEWELGKNECAATAARQRARAEAAG